MKISYEEIGQVVATFACTNVKEGDLVKITASNTVGPCMNGERFFGQVVSVGKDGKTCSVVLKGFITVPCDEYVGTGWYYVSATGDGGIQDDEEGWPYLVVAVDGDREKAVVVL